MTVKLTMLFNSLSGASTPNLPTHRTGGWSESWYFPGTSGPTAFNAAMLNIPGAFGPLNGLATSRAALLGVGTAIVGIRTQVLNPTGPTQSYAVNLAGAVGVSADVPQMALLCTAGGLNVNNVKRFVLRGIPDANVVEGEYSPAGGFNTLVNQFFGALGQWQFRGRDLSQPQNKVISISTAGVITFEAAVTYTVLSMVRVLKTRDANGNLRGGRFQIASIGPGNNIVTLTTWPWGPTTGGAVRSDAVVYPAVDPANTKLSRVVVRKVGRPFVGYRGRRSRRR